MCPTTLILSLHCISTTLFYSPIYLRPWMQKLQQNWNIIITTIIPYHGIWSLSFLVISSCFWFRCGGVSSCHHIVKLLRLTQRNFNLQNTKKSLGLRACSNEKNRNLNALIEFSSFSLETYLCLLHKPTFVLILHANCWCQYFCFIQTFINWLELYNRHMNESYSNKQEETLLFSVASPLFFKISAIVTTVAIAVSIHVNIFVK